MAEENTVDTTKLIEENIKMQKDIESFNTKQDIANKQIEDLTNEVNRLRTLNQELFLSTQKQIPNNNNQTENEEKIYSLDEIAHILSK